MVTARLFCTLICALFLCPQLYAEPPAPTAPTAPPQAPLTWADVTGDGIAEEIRLRAVVREGLSGFDFGVWNPVGDQYLGDIARMPDAPGMFGYVFGAGPDLDGDGLPEIWIADPAAREYVNGRGCVYVYSWQHSLPLMKLQGPPTDTLGTDIRIQTPDSGATWSVHVASHFQDIFGHVYQRWSQYSTAGQLQSTEPPSAGVLILKSGDVDKTLSTDQADVEKVYQKAAELMLELGISGQKHDEDLDGNDLVDAADILAVINSLGVPEPSAASLTASSVYNVAPQRSLYNCSRCNFPCCYAGNCICVTQVLSLPGLNPRWYAAHPGWWKPLSVPPGAVLPPGVYPDRRLTRTPQTPREGCDGFRILPGDIELGGIMVPAVFNPRTDTMTARIDNPSIAQFSADDAGNAMPRESGGDIKLRALLTSSQMIVSNGRIKMYGLIPGDTEIVVEFRTRVGTTTQVEEVRLPVKVGGRIEARVQKVRRWQAPPSWRADHKNAYDAAAAADLAAVRTYSPTGVPRIPIQEPMLGVANGRLGLNPERQGPDSEGEGDDKVLIWDACDQELTDKPTEYFTKRLFIGEDNDNDGISDPQTYLVGQSVNSARIQWSIMQGKGPFADATICEEAHRAEANPGSEIVAVVVGHAAERLRFDINRTPAGTPSNPAHTVSHIRNYYFPRVFGALMGEAGMPQLDPPMYQGGAPEFARWTHRDAGTEKYTPAYHRFNGQDVRFGRAFAPAELPTMEGTVQRQYITGATFAVPIINAALYEAIDKNFNRQETFGVLNL
ncbi:MAG: hypothetical protein Q8L55_07950, partial [Phycisphaerales bacterium]|nr:hypothetical protein [Phycisphaerales bacterium]